MTGDDAIKFPSSDSFDIKMEGFVEWSIIPDKLPLIYTQYGEGGELIAVPRREGDPARTRVASPAGRQPVHRPRLHQRRHEAEVPARVREQARAKRARSRGSRSYQALVRDIVPPRRDQGADQRARGRQAADQDPRAADPGRQEPGGAGHAGADWPTQNQAIGEANKQVVTIVKKAEQERDVAITKAKQELAVAKLRLAGRPAASRRDRRPRHRPRRRHPAEQAGRSRAAAAAGRRLRRDGDAYAQFFFYQKVAPSMKSILTNTDGAVRRHVQAVRRPSERLQGPAAPPRSRADTGQKIHRGAAMSTTPRGYAAPGVRRCSLALVLLLIAAYCCGWRSSGRTCGVYVPHGQGAAGDRQVRRALAAGPHCRSRARRRRALQGRAGRGARPGAVLHQPGLLRNPGRGPHADPRRRDPEKWEWDPDGDCSRRRTRRCTKVGLVTHAGGTASRRTGRKSSRRG